jgi:hypothetical protein
MRIIGATQTEGTFAMAQTVEKVPLGRTGLEVSRLCFGLAPIGDMPDTYGHSVGI